VANHFSTSEGTRPESFGPTEWVLVAVPAAIWGTSFLLIAVALDDFSPPVISFGRIAFGALTLAVLPASRRPVARADWPRLWLLAVFWMALPFLLFPIAEQWIDSSLAGMINGATPLATAIVASALLRRAPGRPQVIGLLVGFGGVVAVVWPAIEGDASLLGALLVLVATASYGLALNLAVPVQQRYGSIPVFFRVQLAAMALSAPAAAAGAPASSFAWDSLVAVAVLGVGASAVAFLAMGALAGRAGATRASIAVYFVPVVAIGVGVAFRDEDVALVSFAGVALVLLGAWLTSRAERSVVRPAPPSLHPGATGEHSLERARAPFEHDDVGAPAGFEPAPLPVAEQVGRRGRGHVDRGREG
jgi:drug/metabolite transporter (DMT)-like permease